MAGHFYQVVVADKVLLEIISGPFLVSDCISGNESAAKTGRGCSQVNLPLQSKTTSCNTSAT